MSPQSMEGRLRMVGVVLVSHEQLAFAMLEAARRMVGALPGMEVACISAGEDSAAVVKKVAEACAKADDGAGVLILVDVHGATPFRVAMSMLDGTRAGEVLCGMNLPMLLKLGTLDRTQLSPQELAQDLCECGRRSIRIGSELSGKLTVGEIR